MDRYILLTFPSIYGRHLAHLSYKIHLQERSCSQNNINFSGYHPYPIIAIITASFPTIATSQQPINY
jgi:hypothetical protein